MSFDKKHCEEKKPFKSSFDEEFEEFGTLFDDEESMRMLEITERELEELINEMVNFLKPIQERRKYYEDHPEEVAQILKDGTEAARNKAKEVMNRVRKNMKLDYFE